MTNRSKKSKVKKPGVSIESAAAVSGIAGGLILMLTGLILSAFSFVSQTRFRSLDVILLAVSFGFLAFGAHFLDRAEAAKKADSAKRRRAIEAANDPYD